LIFPVSVGRLARARWRGVPRPAVARGSRGNLFERKGCMKTITLEEYLCDERETKVVHTQVVRTRIPAGTTAILRREYDSKGDFPRPNAPQYEMSLLGDLTFEGLFKSPWDTDCDEIHGYPTIRFEVGQMTNPDGGPNWMTMTVAMARVEVTIE
jgi:hypothetical protein